MTRILLLLLGVVAITAAVASIPGLLTGGAGAFILGAALVILFSALM